MTFVALLDGDVLYRRGDPASAAYLLLSGQVRMQLSGSSRKTPTNLRRWPFAKIHSRVVFGTEWQGLIGPMSELSSVHERTDICRISGR